jgi:hypothetical protein
MTKLCFVAATSSILLTALAVPLDAQWPLHPVGVPKGADGKPNLTAPPPRTADGKPDLSGIWMIGAGGAGTGIPGGLPFQPWAADLQKMRAAEGGLNDPDGLCLPQGLLQYHVATSPASEMRDVTRERSRETFETAAIRPVLEDTASAASRLGRGQHVVHQPDGVSRVVVERRAERRPYP